MPMETKRLILRKFAQRDLFDFFEYASQSDVGINAGWKPHVKISESFEILKNFIASDEILGIEEKASHKLIGSVGLHLDERFRRGIASRELGYVLNHDYWGHGYMSEAVSAVLYVGFVNMHLEIITCGHYPKNDQSRKVIEKNGFKYEGLIRHHSRLYTGEIMDLCQYSITREEYIQKK